MVVVFDHFRANKGTIKRIHPSGKLQKTMSIQYVFTCAVLVVLVTLQLISGIAADQKSMFGLPCMEGTSCGPRGLCLAGHCVDTDDEAAMYEDGKGPGMCGAHCKTDHDCRSDYLCDTCVNHFFRSLCRVKPH